jgi:sec-independent protein translocase protein TatA
VLALQFMGGQELLVVVVVGLVVIFGASKLPQLMRGMGQGIKEFKQAVKEEDKSALPSSAPPSTAAPPSDQSGTPTP